MNEFILKIEREGSDCETAGEKGKLIEQMVSFKEQRHEAHSCCSKELTDSLTLMNEFCVLCIEKWSSGLFSARFSAAKGFDNFEKMIEERAKILE